MLGKLSPRTAAWLAWSVWAMAVILSLSSVPLRFANGGPLGLALLAIGFGFAFSTTGALIASRRPENPIGWLFCAMSLLFALTGVAQQYATLGLVTRPGSLPGAVFMAWLEQWSLWFVFPAGIGSALLILFPTGRPASRVWWPVLWLGFAFAGLMVFGSMFVPRELSDALRQASGPGVDFNVRNPVGIDALIPLRPLIGIVGRFGAYVVLVTAAIGLVVRLVHAKGEERQQLKWIAFVGAAVALGIVGTLSLAHFPALQDFAFGVVIVGLFVGLPAATAVAVLKYRLYDIDIVINKSLVYGALAIFIGAVYVAIVVGVGTLIGTGGQPNIGLSILATAVVAVAFQPIRERLQRLANRVVYGKRATPYEVLAQFSERVAGTYASTEVLPRMARILAEGTGAARASVWMRIAEQSVPAAVWPEPMTPNGDADRRVTVRHQGEILGELRLSKRPGEPLNPVEEKLLNDLAAQAGLVLRNVRLTADLQARLNDLSEQAAQLSVSRQRIVAAQDAERRRLERNIHDGAQQNLVALTVKLRLASTLVKRNPERARAMLAELKNETRTARTTLADLARGIYPQQLREQGLVEALKPYGPVEAHGIGRYDLDAETAVYFSCLEALQNAAKHARASRVRILLSQEDSTLTFAVIDDGVGFDRTTAVYGAGLQNMRDRLEAVGGRLDVVAAPGKGTTVTGRIPHRALEPVP
jgi:signal transduction histidine kinase